MRFYTAWTALFPVATVALGAGLLMLYEGLLGVPKPADDEEGRYRERLRTTLRSTFAAAVLAVAAAGSIVLWFLARRVLATDPARAFEVIQRTHGLGGDLYALLVFVTLAIGGILVLLQSGSYLRELGLDRPEFPLLVLLSVLGGMILCSARDLLMLFIGLETLSLGTYALVAFQRASMKSTEAALKYFLLGSFAAAILLFGMTLLYGSTGSLDLAVLGRAFDVDSPTALEPVPAAGMALMLVGLAFKVSAVPFHMWTPDAYEGAPTPVTAFMAVVVKTAAFAALGRVLLVAFPFGSPLTSAPAGWVPILSGLAIATMILGNLAALTQRSVKRMLAYSSIAHAGYALVGLVAAGAASTPSWRAVPAMQSEALGAVLYYLLAYTLATAGAFAVLSLCARQNREALDVEDLNGLATRQPYVALAFAVFVLSLLGIPPTAGFTGKLFLFKLAVGAGLVPLAVIGVLTSVASAYYYLRLLSAVYLRSAETEDHGDPVPSVRGRVGLAAAALGVVAFGVLPAKYLSVAAQSVAALFRL